MADQIDKIIIMFELRGAAQAQLILTTMNKVLTQLYGSAGKAAKSVTMMGSATGFASKNIQVMGNMTQSTILKISEFAVVIFRLRLLDFWIQLFSTLQLCTFYKLSVSFPVPADAD